MTDTVKNNPLNRQSIVAILAEKLPDAVLDELFPGIPSAAVRDVLRGKKMIATSAPEQLSVFTPPAATTGLSCKLFTDGASRGNPGEAGAGSVLLDEDNQELAARSQYLGQCTNNVAEYKALILGLNSAIELGCGTLAVFLDSQLIVRQIQGRYKVKHATLKPLFAEVKILLAQIDNWDVDHVPRELNKRADELANRGIDDKNK